MKKTALLLGACLLAAVAGAVPAPATEQVQVAAAVSFVPNVPMCPRDDGHGEEPCPWRPLAYPPQLN